MRCITLCYVDVIIDDISWNIGLELQLKYPCNTHGGSMKFPMFVNIPLSSSTYLHAVLRSFHILAVTYLPEDA